MKRKNTLVGSLKKKGKELDLEEMKKKVQQLHTEPKATKIKAEEPPKPVVKKPAKKKAPVKQRNVRLSVDAPENVYMELKMKVLRDRSNIKEYVLKLIKADLGIK